MTFEAIDIQQTNGAQIIRIPDRMKIADDKVYLRKLGNTLFVIPFHNPWQSLFESLDNFTQDFMEDRNPCSRRSAQTFYIKKMKNAAAGLHPVVSIHRSATDFITWATKARPYPRTERSFCYLCYSKKKAIMQAIEFSTEIKPNHTIEVPEAYAALLQAQQKVRIIILLEEDEEQDLWNKMTTEQFLEGFAEEDSVYDKL